MTAPSVISAAEPSCIKLLLNSSLMITVPVTAFPLALTVTERICVHPFRPLEGAASVVIVDTPAGIASAGTASAITNPAINTSRESRQFMPLTCTCSKDQNRVPPACRSPESYCIRRGWTGANRDRAISAEKQKISRYYPFTSWTQSTGNGKYGGESYRWWPGDGAFGPRSRKQWYALAIDNLSLQGAEAAESAR